MQPITSADRRHAPPSCSLHNDSSLTALPAFACTKAVGDVNVAIDPTAPTGLITTITGGPEPAIIVYSTASSYDGALGGRSGADALCVGSQDRAGRSCTSVHALLSFSGDTIFGMPSTYSIPDLPLKSSNGTTIANHWADTLTGGTRLLASMNASLAATSGYWTFSDGAGMLSSRNCNGGTNADPTPTHYGELGAQGATDVTWLYTSAGNDQGCNMGARVLCICY